MLGFQADETTYKSSALTKRNKIAQRKEVATRCPRGFILRNKIAEANDGLAHKVANQQKQLCPEPYDDLLQLARIGLLKAIERFDPTTGNALSSFAIPYIRGEIQHYLRDKWGSIRVPRRSLELAARMRRIKQYMERHNRTVSETAVADAIGLDEEKLLEVKGAVSASTVSLDECSDVAFSADLTIDVATETKSNWVVGAVASLPSQERSCLLEAFFAGLSLSAIAQRRNVDEFQVKLWIQSALEQLNSEAQAL